MGQIYKNGREPFIQDNISFNRVKVVGIQYPIYPLVIMGDDGVQLGPDAINNGQFIAENGGIINAVDIDWNGAEVEDDVIIYTTGNLLNWIKNKFENNNNENVYNKEEIDQLISSLQTENQNLLNRIQILEYKYAYEHGEEPVEKSYNIIINDSNEPLTIEEIAESINTNVEKPETPQLLDMSSLNGVTESYLVYPLEWEVIENDQIVSPIIKDWNGFEVGFSINEENPIIMINDIEYRVSDIQLGKGSYIIEFK